jgi:hypothetical protein
MSACVPILYVWLLDSFCLPDYSLTREVGGSRVRK